MMNLSLTKKYRPRSVSDMVLPLNHSLTPILNFLNHPYSSAWLLVGKSGLGKSSLAEIISRLCSDPSHVRSYVGSDLDSNRVRDIESSIRHRPLFGKFHFFICDEADQITPGGQIRLLRLLENSENCIWIFTSNESPQSFETRFLSRVKCINFTAQGLLTPASKWLSGIAKLEGLDLPTDEAAKILRATNNNLRNALQQLELRLLEVPALGVPSLSGNHLETAFNSAFSNSSR